MKNTLHVVSVSIKFDKVVKLEYGLDDYDLEVKLDFRGRGEYERLNPDEIVTFIKNRIGDEIVFEHSNEDTQRQQ